MSLERSGSWKTPPFPEIRTINPLTTNTVPYVNELTRTYGDALQRKLSNPSFSFEEYLRNNPLPQLKDQGAFDSVVQGLQTRPNVIGKTDTSGAYKASLDEANRQFNTRLLPQLLESFGARGGRYGSDVARAGANAYGDLQARLGTQAAQSDIAAQEAYAGRELSGSGIYGQQLASLAQVLNLMANLRNVDKQYSYQDYAKNQPETYYNNARSFLDLKPIFPETIVGPSSIYQEKPNIWDYIGRIQQHLQGDASIFGSVAGGVAGSSRKLKEDIEYLSQDEIKRIATELLATPVHRWRYRKDLNLGTNQKLGPMLEDLPQDVAYDEQHIDMTSMQGALLITIQHLAQRIDELEDKLATAEVG